MPSRLRIGDWDVDPASGTIARNGETIRIDVRSTRLLTCLAERAGQVVSIDELIDKVWAGVAVSPDSVYQAVTALRRQLGDDPRQPAYIETVPRLGYRLIAATGPWVGASQPAAAKAGTDQAVGPPASSHHGRAAIWALIAVTAALVFAFILHSRTASSDRPAVAASASSSQPSIGVLPFLDLTEGMRDEEFADGVTEELIDKLSKSPGLSVPSATSSFYYKGKRMTAGEIARGLNVTYLLDGSVRKSNGRVRIAARLVRADTEFVIWTETYDRPLNDLIMVQDDIAGEVAKALRASLVSPSAPGASH